MGDDFFIAIFLFELEEGVVGEGFNGAGVESATDGADKN